MSDRERSWSETVRDARDSYRVPPDVPREAMWAEIESRIEDVEPGGAKVLPLRPAAPARPTRRWVYGSAAAAALLVLGFGVGRWSAGPAPMPAAAVSPERGAIEWAAVDHLGRTENLLTLVQVDGRAGSLEPETSARARALLTETRLLLDAGRAGSEEVQTLLEDLELVLAQLVTVIGGPGAEGESGIELRLALNSLETGDVLPRIRAALPTEFAGP